MFSNKKRPDYCESQLLKARNKNAEYIVVLHGLRRSLKHMQNISNSLHKANFNVLQISYPSTLFTLEKLIEMVSLEIEKHIPQDLEKTVHFVGHSLGGLIIRGLIKDKFLNNLGNIVMIGTPNQGTRFADYFAGYKISEYFTGPVLSQLTSNQEAFKHIFGEIRTPLGIIAGSKRGNYYLGYFLDYPNDGRVSVSDTKLNDMKEHIIIEETHEDLQKNKEVIKQTINFIKHAAFIK